VERDSRTVFLSNLGFATDEARIRAHLSAAGEIADVRLVADFRGRSKGFAYLEYSSIAAAEAALQMDRSPIDGRPCFVSRLKRGSAQQTAGFKYNTGLERNNLFIKGLPFSMTEDDLRQKFAAFGELRDVRLVTYRNGHSKGLAYVDFAHEKPASEALLKMDGTVLSGKTISVALSDPPKARTGGSEGRVATAPPGGTGRGAASRGRGRGRLQVGFMPRALQKKDAANGSGAASEAAPAQAKSNADFRSMLLAKK